MGNSRTDKEVKLYKNSECFKCYTITKPLRLITSSLTGKQAIVCFKCLQEMKKTYKKD